VRGDSRRLLSGHDAIVERLRYFEVERMGLKEPSRDRLRQVVSRLRQLELPRLEAD